MTHWAVLVRQRGMPLQPLIVCGRDSNEPRLFATKDEAEVFAVELSILGGGAEWMAGQLELVEWTAQERSRRA